MEAVNTAAEIDYGSWQVETWVGPISVYINDKFMNYNRQVWGISVQVCVWARDLTEDNLVEFKTRYADWMDHRKAHLDSIKCLNAWSAVAIIEMIGFQKSLLNYDWHFLFNISSFFQEHLPGYSTPMQFVDLNEGPAPFQASKGDMLFRKTCLVLRKANSFRKAGDGAIPYLSDPYSPAGREFRAAFNRVSEIQIC